MSDLIRWSVMVVVGAPLLLLVVLSVTALGKLLDEGDIGLVTRVSLLSALLAAIAALTTFLSSDLPYLEVRWGTWFGVGDAAFAFDLALDGLSLGFVTLSLLICNAVAAFSFPYLHREPGFRRYFVQMAMFVVGITWVALAGSMEVLFVGWELVGLSSALLVGFFQERPAPANNALRVFAIYRLSDAAMLSAAVLLHHSHGHGGLRQLFALGSPVLPISPSGHSFLIALLLILAVAGKSALWPLSGWLPRAMEGPTPSSAVYYGALSIHAGCFLLLRAQPLIASSELATALLIVGGLATSVYGSLTGRVQSDVKSAIAYATLAQVGLIVVEIAFGLRVLPMLHIAGHACFRLLSFLSAPNLLHDHHQLENRLGRPLHKTPDTSTSERAGFYLFALERGFADSLIDRIVVGPFRTVAGRLDTLDRLLVCDGKREEERSK